MTDAEKIRRYLPILEECRFLNSDKPFINITIKDKDIKMSLTKYKKDNSYTREEFKEILRFKIDWSNQNK